MVCTERPSRNNFEAQPGERGFGFFFAACATASANMAGVMWSGCMIISV